MPYSHQCVVASQVTYWKSSGSLSSSASRWRCWRLLSKVWAHLTNLWRPSLSLFGTVSWLASWSISDLFWNSSVEFVTWYISIPILLTFVISMCLTEFFAQPLIQKKHLVPKPHFDIVSDILPSFPIMCSRFSSRFLWTLSLGKFEISNMRNTWYSEGREWPVLFETDGFDSTQKSEHPWK